MFSATDLILVFQAGLYEDDVASNATWDTGDWNGEHEFSSSDLVTSFQDGGYEAGPRTAVLSVPEPSSGVGLLFACAVMMSVSRRSKSSCSCRESESPRNAKQVTDPIGIFGSRNADRPRPNKSGDRADRKCTCLCEPRRRDRYAWAPWPRAHG